jgi:transcriptional regulator with XRE-family HTH domain
VLHTEPEVVKLRRLRYYREHAPMTQAELAEKSGIVQHHLSRIERCEVEPRPSTIRRLAEILGVTVAELIGGPEEDQP